MSVYLGSLKDSLKTGSNRLKVDESSIENTLRTQKVIALKNVRLGQLNIVIWRNFFSDWHNTYIDKYGVNVIGAIVSLERGDIGAEIVSCKEIWHSFQGFNFIFWQSARDIHSRILWCCESKALGPTQQSEPQLRPTFGHHKSLETVGFDALELSYRGLILDIIQ